MPRATSGSARQVPVLHLPSVVEHVVGGVPDHVLDRPSPRRGSAGVVVTDRSAERVTVRAKFVGTFPGVKGRDDPDLLRELVNLGAVSVADDLVAIAPAPARSLAELGGDARGDVVEVGPARP